MTMPPNTSDLAPSRQLKVSIGGIQKLSLVDYPGHVAAALFLSGCNMRCGYCHNPELVLPERLAPSIPVDEVMIFLKSRVGRLDGVVISGGEPTVNEDLPELCRMIKELGFDIKLDTNGTHPDIVREMVEEALIDFIAMDVKGPLEKYVEIAARPIDLEAIKENVRLMIDSKLAILRRLASWLRARRDLPCNIFALARQLVQSSRITTLLLTKNLEKLRK